MFRHSLPLAMILFATACADSPPTGDPGGTFVADDDAPLTGPSAAPAKEIVAEFLRGHGRGAELDALGASRERVDAATGRTHVRFEQHVDGLRVEGAYVKATLSDQGELLHLIDRLVPVTGALAEPRIGGADAVRRAMTDLGIAADTAMYRAPTAEPIAYVTEDGALDRGFLVETWELASNQLHHTIVDGKGRVVSRELRTNSDSYAVFLEDPAKGAQTEVTGGGWLGAGAQTTHSISGPNAHAYLDTDNNNAPDAGGASVTDGNFLTAVDLAGAPSTAGNKAVAVQNLFWANNVLHDVLASHGFTAAAGNFEGNDPVKAEAQDGGGTDNANFSTPADGTSPRMQMYLWTGAGPDAFVDVGATAYGGAAATFGPALTTTGTAGAALAVASPAEACGAVTGVSGKVAIVDRGTCNFTDKVMNAQSAGAVGVIVVNNVGTTEFFAMGGTNKRIRIPSMMIGATDGATIKGDAGATSTLRKNPAPALMIDASLDLDIVAHEYGHGLTWRMIGSMSGKLAGAIGEGASDVNAFLINGDDRIAEYSYSNPIGIRRFPYANYPNTYADVAGSYVHDDGEIYAAAMWRVLELYQDAGLDASDVHDDFVRGMEYTPSAPSFEAMRDGMLAAAPAERDCLIWRGFAQYGVGVGAVGKVAKGGRLSITESFALPEACQ